MRTCTLGKSKIQGTRMAYGCMRISGASDPSKVTPEMARQGVESILAAMEAGYRIFDLADIYGRGACENFYGQALREAPELRKLGVIVSKCGIRWPGDGGAEAPRRYDLSHKHIVWSCEQSLKRLGVEAIDVFLLHRPDFLTDPAEVARAFTDLKRQGKVKEFGVSNFHPTLLAALQAACPMPLLTNQVEIHLGHLAAFTDGTLDQCLALGMTPMAWSPLAGGLLGGGLWLEAGLLKELDAQATAHGCSRAVVALAWLLKHPAESSPSWAAPSRSASRRRRARTNSN